MQSACASTKVFETVDSFLQENCVKFMSL